MALPKEENVTYADYLSWNEDVRCEVLDGKIISLNFSPSRKHQEALTNLLVQFKTYLEGKLCSVLPAPFDVCLFADSETQNENIHDWVEPDLLIVCDEEKFEENRLFGAPDLVVEILSPSNPKNDKVYKMNKYEQAGVEEYWIVDPLYEVVEGYLLREGAFKQEGVYTIEESAPVHIFEHLSIDLKRIFTQ